jgi:biotin operon repressor
MSKSFARDRAIWLDRVAADLSVPAQAFRAAYVLADYFNRETGEAWPSQPTLCNRLGITRSSLKRAIEALEARGHLAVERGRDGNRYRAVNDPAERADEDLGVPEGGSDTDPGGTQKWTGWDPNLNRDGDPNLNPGGGQKWTPTLTIYPPEIDPLEETYIPAPDLGGQEEAADRPNLPVLARPEPDAFEAFWSRYPRHVAKDAARKAFAAVLKKQAATAAELIEGAERYAAERSGQDATFTKHPATWLRGGCWADEPTGTNVVPGPWRGSGPSNRPRSALERAVERLEGCL